MSVPAAADSAAERARLLAGGAASLGVGLAPQQASTLVRYLALLERWNRAYNLTAVRDPLEMVTRHLLDCLAIANLVRGPALLDVGSGAGLPGLVLAVALPRVHATLLDPSLKRTRFLAHAAHTLGLANVSVQRCRLQALDCAVRYDTLTSRASLDLETLMGAAPALLTPTGRLLAMLGKSPAVEPRPPRGFRARLVPVSVPGLEGERHVAVVERAGAC